jgi:hypothetical protein
MPFEGNWALACMLPAGKAGTVQASDAGITSTLLASLLAFFCLQELQAASPRASIHTPQLLP